MTGRFLWSDSATRRKSTVSIPGRSCLNIFTKFIDTLSHLCSPPAVYLESPEIPSQQEAHSDDEDHHNSNIPVVNDGTLVARTPGRGKGGPVSIHRVQPNHVTTLDEFTEAGGVSGGGRDSILYPPPREPAPMPGFSKPVVPEYPEAGSGGGAQDAMSMRSGRTGKSKGGQTDAASMTPSHKIAFQEFHSQLGVRLLKGSLGPVDDVPMMLKSGYRHVYVSRSFALNHGFIPKDTTPGTYGFNGITNLGKWPVKVGSKSVACTVMLAEDSYFPVVLGRSFFEKRKIRTDPVDMTNVIFMDTGEHVDVEVSREKTNRRSICASLLTTLYPPSGRRCTG